jgi:hypothetical protein
MDAAGLAGALLYIHLKHLAIAERIRRWELGSIYFFFFYSSGLFSNQSWHVAILGYIN